MFRFAVTAIFISACVDPLCEIDLVPFFEAHDPIDCKFAHSTFSAGDTGLIGGQVVHDCILDAIATSRAFVGGDQISGIDSLRLRAFTGTVDGHFELLVENRGYGQSVYSTSCSSIVSGGDIGLAYGIGLDCVGGDLQQVCLLQQ